jgi:hypothetical protein
VRRSRKKIFPFEVEIYKCGGCRIDGAWYGPRKVLKAVVEYRKLSQALSKPFIFRKSPDGDTSDRIALRVTTIFMEGRADLE